MLTKIRIGEDEVIVQVVRFSGVGETFVSLRSLSGDHVNRDAGAILCSRCDVERVIDALRLSLPVFDDE